MTGLHVDTRPSVETGDFTAKPALRATDPDVAALLDEELERQEDTLELIPSENLASVAVLEALGSWLNNKYAEGVPGKRYYGGCEVVDKVENLAREELNAVEEGRAFARPFPVASADWNTSARVLNLPETSIWKNFGARRMSLRLAPMGG